MLNPKKKLYRWGPISACPLFMYFTIEPAFIPLKNLLGICYPESLIIFRDSNVLWLLDENETVNHSLKFAQKYALNQKGKEKYLNLWNVRTKKLREEFKRLNEVNIFNQSYDMLINNFNKFSKIYFDWWTITISLELVTITIESLLRNKLKEFYKNRDTKEFTKAFSILTSLPALTFYRREQKDLLKILSLPKNSLKNTLSKHQQKYYWIYNSYLEAKVLDIDYFKSELKKLSKTDYKRLLKEIEIYPGQIKKKKRKIFQEIKAPKDLLYLVASAEKFSQLQDDRKMDNFKADHYLEKFVSFFANKYHLSPLSIKNLLPSEISDISNLNYKELIKSRKQSFVFDCNDRKIICLEGEHAQIIVNQFSKTNKIIQNIIQGTVASTGKIHHFRGTARIVLTIDEIGKIKEGDILITTMTSPDFVIGMKKAGAIITDVGGMLSHAAIVSRELNKPCIVGTQIATKVIQDGDIIEIHSGNGTIKVVKQSPN